MRHFVAAIQQPRKRELLELYCGQMTEIAQRCGFAEKNIQVVTFTGSGISLGFNLATRTVGAPRSLGQCLEAVYERLKRAPQREEGQGAVCGRSSDEMIAIGYRTGGYMYGMQCHVLLGSLRCNEEIHVSVAQGCERRARSNDAQQYSSVYTIKSIDFQGEQYVENDDDDDDDEQRVLQATEVGSVDIVPMRKQRQRFSIGGWERNMVLHRGAVSRMVRTRRLLLHLIVTEPSDGGLVVVPADEKLQPRWPLRLWTAFGGSAPCAIRSLEYLINKQTGEARPARDSDHQLLMASKLRTRGTHVAAWIETREWLLFDDVAWSRRGRVDGAHHAAMATLRRARCDTVVLGQLQCDLERSHLIDATPRSSYFGEVRHRAAWCAIGRILDACDVLQPRIAIGCMWRLCDCSALWPLLAVELVQIIFELLDNLEDLSQS